MRDGGLRLHARLRAQLGGTVAARAVPCAAGLQQTLGGRSTGLARAVTSRAQQGQMTEQKSSSPTFVAVFTVPWCSLHKTSR